MSAFVVKGKTHTKLRSRFRRRLQLFIEKNWYKYLNFLTTPRPRNRGVQSYRDHVKTCIKFAAQHFLVNSRTKMRWSRPKWKLRTEKNTA